MDLRIDQSTIDQNKWYSKVAGLENTGAENRAVVVNILETIYESISVLMNTGVE